MRDSVRARLGHGEARALPDAELVAAMRGGEPAAFAEFHARFRPLLLRQARRLRIRQAWWPDCVDDVLEDAALRLIAEAAPLPRSLAGYLARAARNRFLNMSRDDAGRMRRHAAVAEAPDHPAERVVRSLCSENAKRASGDPWTPPVLDSALSRLGELLTRDLTEEEQQLLAWVAEGVEHRQIAAWLGNSYAATTKRIWRVCARLRELAPVYVAAMPETDRADVERFFRRLARMRAAPPAATPAIQEHDT